jgi:protein-serine/threonine kinase
MSSATLQSAPHQSTSVASRSPVVATSSNRSYTTVSPQSRDPYYNQSPTNALPSTRRPSKRPSANDSPQQPQHNSPSGRAPALVVATRGPTSNHASPVPAADAPREHLVMAPGDHLRGVPPVVSPRTSSNRSGAHAATAAAADRSAKRAGLANESASSPRVTTDGQQDRTDRQRSNGNTQVNGADRGDEASPATSAARSRRRAADSPRDALPHRPSGGREPRTTHSASAVQDRLPAPATGGSTPAGPSREGSEVIRREIISRPEVDIDREQARMAEAIPSSPTSNQPGTPIGTLSVVGAEGVEDGGRGPRSRHDHSSSAKPEKSSRFGEYYLGNTLGEGEFGKVKMGWKQEGGVQVGCLKRPKRITGVN